MDLITIRRLAGNYELLCIFLIYLFKNDAFVLSSGPILCSTVPTNHMCLLKCKHTEIKLYLKSNFSSTLVTFQLLHST